VAEGSYVTVDDGIRDTLIDCMTSFLIHGDKAAEATDFIMSASSGLTITVTDPPAAPEHEYADSCDCDLCVGVRIEDME
jgi:hypothetical protein